MGKPEWLTQMVDSSGVASLIEGLKASRDLGSRFILLGLSTSAKGVLQLSRLIKVFEIYDKKNRHWRPKYGNRIRNR